MTQIQDILIRLIRAGIGMAPSEIPAGFDGWKEVIDMSFDQGVAAITVDGYNNSSINDCLLERDESLEDMKYEWFGSVLQEEEETERRLGVAKELESWWAAEGIRARVLKGSRIARYYPKPEHRFSCDLDVFIPEDGGWKRACEVLKGKGIELCYEVYKEVEFTHKGVYVECHRFITPVRGNRNLMAFERYLRGLLEAEDELMFTAMLYVEHALGDFLKGPMTLRQLVDWMVLRRQALAWEEFDARCREFGFERFRALADSLADVAEGSKSYEELPKTYRRAWDEMWERPKKGGGRRKSWTQRRVSQFFDVLRCRWKYGEFGYMTMLEYLAKAMWGHWVDKKVRI